MSFSLIGIFAKVADTRQCRPGTLYFLMYGWGLASAAVLVSLLRHGDFSSPATIWRIAVPFGMLASLAGIVFQIGIRYGKISTSWLVINLSAAIPAAGSLIFYHEPVSMRKVAVLLLVAVSVFLLWKDKQSEEPREGA